MPGELLAHICAHPEIRNIPACFGTPLGEQAGPGDPQQCHCAQGLSLPRAAEGTAGTAACAAPTASFQIPRRALKSSTHPDFQTFEFKYTAPREMIL